MRVAGASLDERVVLVGRTSHAKFNPFDLSFLSPGKEPRCCLVGRLDATLGPRRDVAIACLPANPFRVLMSIPVARVFRVYVYIYIGRRGRHRNPTNL